MFTEYLDAHPLLPLLLPKDRRIAIPRASDRDAWRALPEETLSQIARAAQEARDQAYPPLTATQFLAFVRSGSRAAYETPYFARRRKLMAAVLGACIGQDEDMDAVVDGIWTLCEESFWGISAHNGSDHPGARPAKERPLPDVENPYVDLFAAQTAALLSFTCYLLGDVLDRVTPLLRRRVRLEVERRIFAPFLRRDDFWWMGMIRRDVNNWTPWILSNVMASLLLWEDDDLRLAEGLARAMRMLDSYLAVLPEDGGCDEGTAYWNMAGGALLDCLELLYDATGGRVCFYQEPLIRRIGEFPLKAHIDGPYYWNFADADACPVLDGERLARYGERIENPVLTALGARILAENPDVFPRDTPEMSRVLDRLFHPVSPPKTSASPEEDISLPYLGVFAKRRGRLYLAVKGGHNGESHNHNDVGSFLLYVDGKPAVIDPGNMVYTAKTFGPERYTLPNTRSANHSVPLIGGVEQAPGAPYRARDVSWDTDCIRMDIGGAYPPRAGVLSLLREARLTERALALSDEVRLLTPEPVTWVFMLRQRPEITPGLAECENVSLRFDADLSPALEEWPVTDARMARSFPGSVFRLALTASAADLHARRFLLSPGL